MKIKYWVDSEFIWLNLSQEQLQDWKKYKWTIWEKTAVKMYYNLTEEQLKLYHKIHNIFYEQVNNIVLNLDEQVEIEWKKFKEVKVKVLKLKDSFITYAKLLNKVKKWLLDKNAKFSIVSLQDYVKWNNLAVDIWKLFDEMENELKKWPILYNEGICANIQEKKHNLEWLQIQVIMELTQKFPYYKPPQNGPQISTDNIKYYVENDELIVYITDVWWDIEKLLNDYKEDETKIIS